MIKQSVSANQLVHDLSFYLRSARSLKTKKSNSRVRAGTKILKIACISSYTITGLAAVLQVFCREAGIVMDFFEVPYKQFNQYILDEKSKLYSFKPDITFFLTDTLSFFPAIESIVARKGKLTAVNSQLKRFKQLIGKLANLNGTIVVSTFVQSSYDIFGSSDLNYAYSTNRIIQKINNTLTESNHLNKKINFFNMQQFVAELGSRVVFDHKMKLLGDYFISPSAFPYLGYKLMGYIKAVTGKTRKCIVVDLDNTLWGGIIGEDGLQGIALGDVPPGNAYSDFQKTLLRFYQRGILLAINSNNNEKDALEVLEKHPNMLLKSHHFAARRINWHDKASNMKDIAKELNIGLDSVVFIDDDPKKRLMMQKLIPEILTIELPKDPSLYSSALLQLNDFTALYLTEEDFVRGKQYFEQAERHSFKNTVSDLSTYLKSLQVTVRLVPIDKFTIPRIAQLTARTNQFNMTTRRYAQDDIIRFLHSNQYRIYAAEVLDRFGSYGICGVIIVRCAKDNFLLDTFLLSCRVLGMGVEQSLLHHIAHEAKESGAHRLIGHFIPTAKNKPAEDVYKTFHFTKTSQERDVSTWELLLKKQSIKNPAHITFSYDS